MVRCSVPVRHDACLLHGVGPGSGPVAQLCVYTFASAGKSCHDLPEAFSPYPYQLAWSPDETTIAFSENPIEFGYESDIWLLDVISGQVSDVTDDGLNGSWRSMAAQGGVALDYLPFWDKTDGSLLFWRVTPLGRSPVRARHLPAPEGC